MLQEVYDFLSDPNARGKYRQLEAGPAVCVQRASDASSGFEIS